MKLWSMKQLTALGDLHHLFTGWDTTFTPSDIGQAVALTTPKKSRELPNLPHTFLGDDSFDSIQSAGLKHNCVVIQWRSK